MKKFVLLSFLLVFLAACGTEHVDKAKWQTMSADDQLLYVKSLLGAEQVKESKGGTQKRHPHPPEVYAAAIREYYRTGDARQPEEIFEALAEKPKSEKPAAAPAENPEPVDPHDMPSAKPAPTTT